MIVTQGFHPRDNSHVLLEEGESTHLNQTPRKPMVQLLLPTMVNQFSTTKHKEGKKPIERKKESRTR